MKKKHLSDFQVEQKLKDTQIFPPRVDNITMMFRFPFKTEDHIKNGIPFGERSDDIIDITRILCNVHPRDVTNHFAVKGRVWSFDFEGIHFTWHPYTLRVEFQGRYFCRTNGFNLARQLLSDFMDNFPEGTVMHNTRVDIEVCIKTQKFLVFPLPTNKNVKVSGSPKANGLKVQRNKKGKIESAFWNFGNFKSQFLKGYCKSAQVLFRERNPVVRDYYISKFGLDETRPDNKRIMRVELMLRGRQCLTFFHHAFYNQSSEEESAKAALSTWATDNLLVVKKKRNGKIEWICPENFKKIFFLREYKRNKWAKGFPRSKFYTSTRKKSVKKALRTLVHAEARKWDSFTEDILLERVKAMIPEIFKQAAEVRSYVAKSRVYLNEIQQRSQKKMKDYITETPVLPSAIKKAPKAG